MKRRLIILATCGTMASVCLCRVASGSETVTHSYDALGRLASSAVTGGPNSSRITNSCFDAAGNRMRYDVATSTPAPCPTPAPTPVPTS